MFELCVFTLLAISVFSDAKKLDNFLQKQHNI